MALKAHQVAEVCKLVGTITDDDSLARAFNTTTETIAALRSLVERRHKRSVAPLPKVEVIKNEHPAWSIEYCDRQHELEMKDGSARLLAAIRQALDAR